MSVELENLLNVDPYEALVKPNKTEGTKKTRASKNLVICYSIPELPIGS